MKLKITIISLALLAMAAGFWVSSSLHQRQGGIPAVSIQGAVLPAPRQIKVPALSKDDGTAFTSQDLRGNWTLMFFGYTHCPDICPATMHTLAQAKKQGSGPFPEVVFVTVDPRRDRLDMLGEYVRYFDEEFVGVTGEDAMIEALTLQLGVVYMQVPGTSGSMDDYLVDHSSQLLLIDPEGRLAAFLQAPHTPATVLQSVNAVVSAG